MSIKFVENAKTKKEANKISKELRKNKGIQAWTIVYTNKNNKNYWVVYDDSYEKEK